MEMDQGSQPQVPGIGIARYFMVLGMDVAVRTAGLALREGCSVAQHIVPPAAGMPLHAISTDILLVVLQGNVAFTSAGQDALLGDTHTAFVPAGTSYGYHNHTRQEAQLMIITLTGRYGDFLQEIARNPKTVLQAAARHGVELGRGAW
jgi:quercetin dioxygenase-like cupin family protein